MYVCVFVSMQVSAHLYFSEERRGMCIRVCVSGELCVTLACRVTHLLTRRLAMEMVSAVVSASCWHFSLSSVASWYLAVRLARFSLSFWQAMDENTQIHSNVEKRNIYTHTYMYISTPTYGLHQSSSWWQQISLVLKPALHWPLSEPDAWVPPHSKPGRTLQCSKPRSTGLLLPMTWMPPDLAGTLDPGEKNKDEDRKQKCIDQTGSEVWFKTDKILVYLCCSHFLHSYLWKRMLREVTPVSCNHSVEP